MEAILLAQNAQNWGQHKTEDYKQKLNQFELPMHKSNVLKEEQPIVVEDLYCQAASTDQDTSIYMKQGGKKTGWSSRQQPTGWHKTTSYTKGQVLSQHNNKEKVCLPTQKADQGQQSIQGYTFNKVLKRRQEGQAPQTCQDTWYEDIQEQLRTTKLGQDATKTGQAPSTCKDAGN